jgi:hypothetical protein
MKRTSRITKYLSTGLLAAVVIAGVTRPAQSLDNGGGGTGGGTGACYLCKTTYLPFQRVIIAQCVSSSFQGVTKCEEVTIWPAGTQTCNTSGSTPCVVNGDDGSVFIP